MGVIHVPVMLAEVLEGLKLKDKGIYIDGTVGSGGHAEGILKNAGGCTLIGLDKDEDAIKMAGERLKGYDVHLIKSAFSDMESVIKGLGYEEVDGILLDLGVSTLQLKSVGRGFSFSGDDVLDMRMDRGQRLTALKIINEYSEKDLADIFWRYGEERHARKIARVVVSARKVKPIRTCSEFAGIIMKAVGRKDSRIHPATRTFQALRIEVNKELDELSAAIPAGTGVLKKGGRFCVISYHSLEDRVVKHSFRKLADNGIVSIITRKPLTPSMEERRLNPSSRSAKLRITEKL